FARSHIREYARMIGADPDAVVNEFCRWFEKGDRRAFRVVSEQAQIVGHDLEWRDDGMHAGLDGDRRAGSTSAPAARPVSEVWRIKLLLRLRRAIGKA